MPLPAVTKNSPLSHPQEANFSLKFVDPAKIVHPDTGTSSHQLSLIPASDSQEHPSCNSVFFTRQLLPGYPKTHLPTQHPYEGCTVDFQMKIDKIVGLDDQLLFVKSTQSRDNSHLHRESAIKHENDTTDEKTTQMLDDTNLASDRMDIDEDLQEKKPYIEHYHIAEHMKKLKNLQHMNAEHKDPLSLSSDSSSTDQLAIDSFIVDKVLSDQIATLNRVYKTAIQTEQIYMSDINEGEKMTLSTQWSEGDIHTMAERLEDGTKNIPVLEYLLGKMQVGEKLRIFCSSNYFIGFEEAYNLVEGEAHPNPKKLLQEQAHLQYEREHPEPHGEDVMVVDDGDSLGFIPHADSKVPKNLNRNISVAIPKYLVIEIESNIFDLPEVDRIKEARICKENGNKAFQGNNFDSALDHYFKGQSMVQEAYDFEIPSLRIEACNLLGEIILNICAILLKRNNASSVLQFTDEISKLFPNDENSYIMVKALFRRAQANAIREEYDAALQDLNHALTLESTNGALLSLRKRLLVKRKQQRSKEKTLYSAFFKKSSAFVDNEHYIAENLLKTLKSQEGHSGLPLNVVFNISEFLGFDIFNFALVCKDFHHVACELEDRWKLLCLRFKFYNASRDPDVYKWKNHCILVYKTVRWTFNLPNNLRRAAFPELAEVYRGSSEFFVDVCRRIADQMDKNKVYESEDAMIYSSLKELHRYWTLEKIYEFFGVQVEFGKPNTNEGTVELLNKNIEEYYHESAPEDRESAKYMFERSKTITTVDEAFDMMMESQWGLHGTIPTLMRCGFTYYNIQPKNLKMGFFCSDGLLALILEDQGFLHEGTIRKWMK